MVPAIIFKSCMNAGNGWPDLQSFTSPFVIILWQVFLSTLEPRYLQSRISRIPRHAGCNFCCYHLPGQPPKQNRPFWTGGGEFFKQPCPEGRGWGKVKTPTRTDLWGDTMFRTALSALRANLSNLLMDGWIETKNPCSEAKCTRELLTKDQNMFISLYMERFFFPSAGAGKLKKNRKSPGVCPGGEGMVTARTKACIISNSRLDPEHLLQCNTVILQNEMM